MNGTTFNNSFRQIIRPITTLKKLSLQNCRLNGTLHDQGLCEMMHLEELDISYNALRDTLPPCLANLTSLQSLDISSNQIIGNISSSPLKDMTSIRVLRISNNLLQIPVSLTPLYNLSKLKEFESENNQMYIEKMPHSLTPKFQLNSITLAGYGYGATFPRFLYHQYDLQNVNLSHIKLNGEFPNWLIENNTKLERLYLSNNSLSGPFLLPTHSHMSLTIFDISINSFSGQIPIEVGAFFPRLLLLNISRNALNGSIPSSFGDMSSLQILDLSHNQLSGEIPEQLTLGCFSLEYLVLSNNSLEGPIFSKKINLTSLMRLQLDGNNFTGKIPEVLSNCSLLEGLYFSDNHLTGRIPRWLGNLSLLEDIIMPNNHLEGPIPTELCQLGNLQVLDLSNNSISGSLPSCSRNLSIKQLHLSRNMLQGHLNNLFLYSPSLVTLDLSFNQLYGSIAKWIDRLSSLNYLILKNNSFEGEVPTHLCKLNQLRLIDLSHNNFFGQIPFCLLDREDSDAKAPTSSFAPAPDGGGPRGKEETIPFTTKNVSYLYEGKVLTYMSGIDLSCNKLTGEIPYQIGLLTRIHTLNLSHNNLTGSIPMTFSHLQQIESLDLSYNNLNGKIPPQLVGLYTLSFFSVAYNNLSGKTPEMNYQFATFGESSYEGNPLLYGPPLPKCDANGSSSSMPRASTENDEDNNFIDVEIFYISFTVSYIIVLLGIATILYINPYWRRAWFYHVEMWTTSSYYFVVDHLPTPLHLRRM
ncbi:receptor-like protein 1 [Pistacia vera]|uniref:receptor-like protein 1 n=1 Tax=Pistacia vera TaxID=55513 RepID=UPI00126342DE|nr:receptor-like protein 1 [Pistacia vera]